MKKCILILDNIRSVENTGSIFRTAEGLGVEEIILVGTTPAPIDRFGRKRSDFAKVALGAEEIMKWEYQKDAEPIIQKWKEEGYAIIALEQSPASEMLASFEASKLTKLVLIVGNEVEGVSKEVLDLADHVLEIPMKGKKESLNVSVATGIALYSLLNSS